MSSFSNHSNSLETLYSKPVATINVLVFKSPYFGEDYYLHADPLLTESIVRPMSRTMIYFLIPILKKTYQKSKREKLTHINL